MPLEIHTVFPSSRHHCVPMAEHRVPNISPATGGQIPIHTEAKVFIYLCVGDSWVQLCSHGSTAECWLLLPSRHSPDKSLPAGCHSGPSLLYCSISLFPLFIDREQKEEERIGPKHEGKSSFSKSSFLNKSAGLTKSPGHPHIYMESLHISKSNVKCVSQVFKMCIS